MDLSSRACQLFGTSHFAGHFGASLTHGEDFVWAPLQEEEVQSYDPEAPAYQTAVYPILEAKCVACHKEEKSKGDLIMTSIEAILKGGERRTHLGKRETQRIA